MSAKPRKHERLLTQLIDALPKCEQGDCRRPATKTLAPGWEGDDRSFWCDEHRKSLVAKELPYANALREATE